MLLLWNEIWFCELPLFDLIWEKKTLSFLLDYICSVTESFTRSSWGISGQIHCMFIGKRREKSEKESIKFWRRALRAATLLSCRPLKTLTFSPPLDLFLIDLNLSEHLYCRKYAICSYLTTSKRPPPKERFRQFTCCFSFNRSCEWHSVREVNLYLYLQLRSL